ncbi:putative bifunctional diguanylate cyclase/phosphodiesterase [Sulfuricaulis sp.]|jgi:diguanylate cyclase (GGDEF)-like protein/PAS domain S-box-containing protein|uniref:putative bifunctional diguanylate cyclase/phosphodiesterase n=1 Tax=Sulfuricaulis sp. TaxID=2003553 RepID=UPI00355A676D
MYVDLTTLIVAIGVTFVATMWLTLWYPRLRNPTSSIEKPAAPAGTEHLRTVLDNIADAVMTVDSQGVIGMLNPVAAGMFGYMEGEALGKNVQMLLTDIRAGGAAGISTGTREVVGVRKSGATFQVGLTVHESGNKDLQEFVLIARDITAQKQAEQRLVYLAQYDALTGLPTRALFHDRATHALARANREEKLVAIMYLDLDHFKNVNDGLGHQAGDELLKAVAKRITSCLRDVDTVSRMGGDEFTVILESIPHIDNATIVAEKILDVMQEPFHVDGHEIHVTISIGITIYPMDDKDLTNLLKDSDQAMYRAKQAGRNNFQIFGADMAESMAAVKLIETQIEHALERGELLLHYQPRLDLLSGNIIGVEALLRWRHPEMGMISAKDFMPQLERSKLVYSVDEWVLRTACLQNRQWQKVGLPSLCMTVNVSPYRFRRKGLVELVTNILKETGLSPGDLELDIPAENLVGIGQENYRTVLDKLNTLGVHVALADNGIGDSFIDSIKRLSLRVMKIDRSFVRNAAVDPDHAAIVQAVIALARALKLKVVAEGVETAEQLADLRRYGCDMAQGYLFSKPVATEDIASMLRDGRRLV